MTSKGPFQPKAFYDSMKNLGVLGENMCIRMDRTGVSVFAGGKDGIFQNQCCLNYYSSITEKGWANARRS